MKRRDKSIRYQDHAVKQMHWRSISRLQVAKTVRNPDAERKARREGATRFEKKLSTRRRLGVIADEYASEFLVITAFWM